MGKHGNLGTKQSITIWPLDPDIKMRPRRHRSSRPLPSSHHHHPFFTFTFSSSPPLPHSHSPPSLALSTTTTTTAHQPSFTPPLVPSPPTPPPRKRLKPTAATRSPRGPTDVHPPHAALSHHPNAHLAALPIAAPPAATAAAGQPTAHRDQVAHVLAAVAVVLLVGV